MKNATTLSWHFFYCRRYRPPASDQVATPVVATREIGIGFVVVPVAAVAMAAIVDHTLMRGLACFLRRRAPVRDHAGRVGFKQGGDNPFVHVFSCWHCRVMRPMAH
jgi:hypothetical protein